MKFSAMAVALGIGLGFTAWSLPRHEAVVVAWLAIAVSLCPYILNLLFLLIYGRRAVIFGDGRVSLWSILVAAMDLSTNSPNHWLSSSNIPRWSKEEAEFFDRYLRLQRQLISDVEELRDQVTELHRSLTEAQRKSAVSSIISFWAGVAISIPIGVLINLATG